MKIVQIIPTLNLAGAERMCETLSIELKRKGNDVIVVSLFSVETPLTRNLKSSGIDVIFLNKKSGFDFSIIIKLIKLFNKYKPDVVHTHINSLQYTCIAASVCKVKAKVHTMHNLAEKEATPIKQHFYNFAFHCLNVYPISLSDEIQESVIRRYRLEKKHTPIIYNGIDLNKCIMKTSYESQMPFTIINIGRLTKQKNQLLILDVVEKLLDSCDDIVVKIYGSGELQEMLEQEIVKRKLEKRVILCGLTNDVYTALNHSDIFLFTSKYEGMPMTLIEAMTTGLPIVSTNVGGVPSMIDDGIDGLLTGFDSENIADRINELYLDENLRRQIGENAHAKAMRKFSSVGMCDRYLDVYKMIAEREIKELIK